MRCAVFGATGYLGTRLIPELLSAGHDVRVLARHPAKLDDVAWRDRVEVLEGDVTDCAAVHQALHGQDVLYYLVHSLMRPDFVEFDARAAGIVADAATRAGLSRIVYVGGIIPDQQKLSDHLTSRAHVGRLLRASGVPTVELRAAAIIGAGSASFEMLRYLTDRLPLMITPRWLRTCVQPIAVRDVLHYLVHAARLPADVNRPFDIGGPDRFTYMEMIRRYAAVAGLPRRIALPVPVLSPWLSAQWIELVTPIPRTLAVSLMESLENDMVCADHDIAHHIPDPNGGLTHYEDAVELALAHVRNEEVRTRWSRADGHGGPSRPLPTDPDWAGGSLYQDVRHCRPDTDPATLWHAIESAGAEHGWSASPLAWSLRGWTGKLPGAPGLRRAMHAPRRLHTGEALDWWRVEHIERPQVLRLRAELPLPGRLWLELSVQPGQNGGSAYQQRVLFQPYGLAGQALWRVSGGLRDAVFGGIARDIAGTSSRRHHPNRRNAPES
ncbi:MAG: DUF2867 domain-containing protein [Mycobacteriaceae bacterium]|nr:DUF2867 domain-containing protein [Mycobacteriaceae bacterium]